MRDANVMHNNKIEQQERDINQDDGQFLGNK